MSLIHGSFYSESLKFQTHFNAILPIDSENHCAATQKVMILLHGMMDGCDSWLTQTAIHAIAMEHNILVFMPEGQRSFYVNMEYGGKYQTFLSYELPRLLQQMFGIQWSREKSIIAGNSMGGYGALLTAFSHPQLFSRCIAFSPVISPLDSMAKIPDFYQIPQEIIAVFGKNNKISPSYDLYHLSSGCPQPFDLHIACGTEDFLFAQSRDFHTHLNSISFCHNYVECPGEHGWAFWKRALLEWNP